MTAGRAGAAALLAAASLACAAPAVAAAEAVSAAELRSLGRAAERDADARERLRSIDTVDGRPVAMDAIVAGARPDEVAARVELALAASASASARAGAGTPPAARTRAQKILRERRYTGTDVPRPFTGALRWIGERLAPVARLLDRIAGAVPGGRSTLFALLGALVLALALVVTRRAIRRGAGRSGVGARAERAARAQDPGALERDAEAAERDGRHEAAVRLRMRAGLLRLDSRGLIDYRPSLTTGEVGRALGSPAFDTLGRDFDAIAYGGQAATAADARAAREGWRAVLAERPAEAAA